MGSPFFFEGTRYWSPGDEKAHFDWMQSIPCVRDVQGEGVRVYLYIDLDAVTVADIYELDALYRRYGGDRDQLARLKESSNA